MQRLKYKPEHHSRKRTIKFERLFMQFLWTLRIANRGRLRSVHASVRLRDLFMASPRVR